jgi:hypothetical protein
MTVSVGIKKLSKKKLMKLLSGHKVKVHHGRHHILKIHKLHADKIVTSGARGHTIKMSAKTVAKNQHIMGGSFMSVAKKVVKRTMPYAKKAFNYVAPIAVNYGAKALKSYLGIGVKKRKSSRRGFGVTRRRTRRRGASLYGCGAGGRRAVSRGRRGRGLTHRHRGSMRHRTSSRRHRISSRRHRIGSALNVAGYGVKRSGLSRRHKTGSRRHRRRSTRKHMHRRGSSIRVMPELVDIHGMGLY